MELKEVNSLVELFFEKYKEKKELINQPFLKWLKTDEKDFLTIVLLSICSTLIVFTVILLSPILVIIYLYISYS